MKDSRKKSHRHDKAVKAAYNLLVSYRKLMEEKVKTNTRLKLNRHIKIYGANV